MKRYLTYFFFLVVSYSFAQKTIEKTFHIKELKYLELEFNHVFEVSIKTLRTNIVTVTAKSEGEFANYFTLETKEEKDKLILNSAVDFAFKDANDKLSAHKVQAIKIELTVPENLVVTLKSDIANLLLKGEYDRFTAQLTSGNSVLHNVRHDVEINSILGNIEAYTNFTVVEAQTRQGSLNTEAITEGKTHYVLKTIKGDITVKKTK